MVLLNGYPSVAKFIHINTSYSTTDQLLICLLEAGGGPVTRRRIIIV